MRHPDTASRYAAQLHYLKNGQRYNYGELEIGDRIEIELDDRIRWTQQPFPRGSIKFG